MAQLDPIWPVREIVTHDRPGWISVRMVFDATGASVRGHAHAFDHLMTVEAGRCVISAAGEGLLLSAGESFMVPAHVEHSIVGADMGTVVRCEHEIRHENGDIDPMAFAPGGIPVEWLQRLTDTWGPPETKEIIHGVA